MLRLALILPLFFGPAVGFPGKGSPGEPCPVGNAGGPEPANPDVTKKGCTCTTECGASLPDGFNIAWCYTKDGCGSWSFGGTWDECVYPVDKAWESHPWRTKHDYFVKQIRAGSNDYTPAAYPNPLEILGMSVRPVFDDQWDVLPRGRSKKIHAVGVICEFAIDIPAAGNSFTGIFSAGKKTGLIRLGNAVDLPGSGAVPGVGVKFFRDGVSSANFVGLHDLGGTPGDWNFFSKPLFNHLGPASGPAAILAKKFEQASKDPTKVGLSDFARADQVSPATNGPGLSLLRGPPAAQNATTMVFPYMVTLQPTGQATFPGDKPIDVMTMVKQLESIPAGTPIYELLACKDKSSSEQGSKDGTEACSSMSLGSLTTVGSCTRSKYGDEKLFIKHQRIEEDWALKPDWVPAGWTVSAEEDVSVFI